MIYRLRINKSCLMKGSLVENTKIIVSKARSSKIIKNEVEWTPWINDESVSTNQLKEIVLSWYLPGRIKRRKLVTTMERCDMRRKHDRRKKIIWKKSSRILKRTCRIFDWSIDLQIILLCCQHYPMHYIPTLLILNG